VEISDDNTPAGTVTQDIVITITGENDLPSVTSVNPATQVEGNTGTFDVQVIDIFADLVTATDIDASDIPALDDSSVVIASAGGAPLGLVTTDGVGNVTYDLADFDYLAVGESAIYEISFDVVSGPDTVSQTVTLTITGENDAPVVAMAVTGGSTEDDASFTVDLLEGASDVDASDTLNISDLQLLIMADDSGVTVNGNSLEVDPSAYNYLAVGESLVLEYIYNVVDGNGGVTAQSATITITGQNDAPVAVAVTGATEEDGSSITISADFVDVDLSDTHIHLYSG